MRRFENAFTAWLLVLVFTWTSVFSASGISVPPSKNASGIFFGIANQSVWKNVPPALIPYRKNCSSATIIASVSQEHDLVSQDRKDGAGGFEMSFYSYDGLGSVRGLTDAVGTSLGQYHYDSYGLLIEDNVTVANPYLFAGERFDNDLGLYYLRARYLDVETGRFHTLDTYEGRGNDPLTLHKYLYAHANPISNIDPSGRLSLAQQTAAVGFLVNFSISLSFSALFTDDSAYEALIQAFLAGTLGMILGPASQSLSRLLTVSITRILKVANATGIVRLNIGAVVFYLLKTVKGVSLGIPIAIFAAYRELVSLSFQKEDYEFNPYAFAGTVLISSATAGIGSKFGAPTIRNAEIQAGISFLEEAWQVAYRDVWEVAYLAHQRIGLWWDAPQTPTEPANP